MFPLLNNYKVKTIQDQPQYIEYLKSISNLTYIIYFKIDLKQFPA